MSNRLLLQTVKVWIKGLAGKKKTGMLLAGWRQLKKFCAGEFSEDNQSYQFYAKLNLHRERDAMKLML